jgi:fatty-acyl-CoA synthase
MTEAAEAGGRLTVLDKNEPDEVSFVDLLGESRRKAAGLSSLGVARGDRVAAFAHTSYDFVAACLAIWHAGGVVVSLPPPSQLLAADVWARRVESAIEAADVRLVVAADADARSLHVESQEFGSIPTEEATFDRLEPSDPALIQFSSGTTREPVGVLISHGALTAQTEGLKAIRPNDPIDDHCVSWVPLYHDLGLLRCLFMPMAAGSSVTLLPTRSFVQDPGQWLLEISRRGGTFASAPNFGYALATRAALKGFDEPVDLSGWTASCGGELIDPNTLRRFFEATEQYGFEPSLFTPGYGLAESTCVVTVTRPGAGVLIDPVDRSELASGKAIPADPSSQGVVQLVSVGRPVPGTKVRIVSDEGAVLGDREVGEVEAGGPCLMDRYVGRGMLAIEDGWLHTGDRGYLVDEHLYVTGRIKDVIVIRGQNFYAEDLERVAQDATGVRRGRCMAVGVVRDDTEQLVLAAETRLTDPEELQACKREIARLLLRETELAPAEVRLLPPNSLPRSTSGKLQRGLFRQRLEAETDGGTMGAV